MLKHLFLGLTMSATLLAAAEDQTQTPPESTPSNPLDDILVTEKVINDAVEILESIDGYIFLERYQTRDLSNTFSRTNELFSGLDESEIKGLDFKVKNEDIAGIDDENKGKVTGRNYGQTLLIVSDPDDIIKDGDKKENYYFIVLVCPTISIVTPDGVVYKHQKIYNQKTKVDFTHSANFAINSVMANYGNEFYDITDKIDSNGHYESEVNISSDVIYTVTLEEDPEDNLLGKSPYRILVDNGNIWFALADSGLKGDETDEQKADKLENDLKEMTIVTSTPKNRGTAERPNMGEVQVYTTSNGEKIDFSGSMPKYTAPFNDGVYFLTLTIGDKSYKYKIVLNR